MHQRKTKGTRKKKHFIKKLNNFTECPHDFKIIIGDIINDKTEQDKVYDNHKEIQLLQKL